MVSLLVPPPRMLVSLVRPRTRCCYGGLWLWLSLRTAAALRTLVIELEPSFDLVRSAVELVRRKLSYRRYYQPGSGHNLIEVWFNYCLRIFSSEIYLVYNSVYLVLPGCQLPEAWVRENLISNGGNKFSDERIPQISNSTTSREKTKVIVKKKTFYSSKVYWILYYIFVPLVLTCVFYRIFSMEYSYLQQPSFDSSCNITGMPASESAASQSFYRYHPHSPVKIF